MHYCFFFHQDMKVRKKKEIVAIFDSFGYNSYRLSAILGDVLKSTRKSPLYTSKSMKMGNHTTYGHTT